MSLLWIENSALMSSPPLWISASFPQRCKIYEFGSGEFAIPTRRRSARTLHNEKSGRQHIHATSRSRALQVGPRYTMGATHLTLNYGCRASAHLFLMGAPADEILPSQQKFTLVFCSLHVQRTGPEMSNASWIFMGLVLISRSSFGRLTTDYHLNGSNLVAKWALGGAFVWINYKSVFCCSNLRKTFLLLCIVTLNINSRN